MNDMSREAIQSGGDCGAWVADSPTKKSNAFSGPVGHDHVEIWAQYALVCWLFSKADRNLDFFSLISYQFN